MKKRVLTRDESLRQIKDNGKLVVKGANLVVNEYGTSLFADFFFFITGFHGFHVFSGVVINIIIFFNVILGTYERRGSYEMVEKVGLILALCRFSLGICIYILLPSLILDKSFKMADTHIN